MGQRDLVALFVYLCLLIVVWLFLVVSRICLQFVIVVFPDHSHSQFSSARIRRVKYILSKEDGEYQKSIQSSSTPDPGHHMEIRKHHIDQPFPSR